VLDRPLEVIGPIALCLFVASSTPDTDFTSKLVDVYPDGRAIPERLEPDAIYEIRLDL
jgi:predicted acyl esterase